MKTSAAETSDNKALTHVVTLAGRDSSSAHRKFAVRDGMGSTSSVGEAQRFSEEDAEAMADKIAARGGYVVAWCAEPANEALPDW
jgi:hypothetical protein